MACRPLAVAFLIVLALPPSTAGAQDISPSLDDVIAGYAKAHDFSGTVLVQQQGRRRYARSFGQADIAHGVAHTPQTRYWVASITKLFTAALVLQLHEQGRLDLQATLASYLPECTGAGARTITVHQLLNHTSGLENFDQVTRLEQALAEGMPHYQLPRDPAQLARGVCNGPQAHAPGTTFDYNNGDYLLLGRIIETITGTPYAQALRERILAPLHLADTGLLRHADIVPGLAATYSYREDLKALANDLPVYPENWGPSGALYSTVDDVLAFSDALFGARLISRDSLARLLAPGLDEYGYGLWVYTTRVGHDTLRVAKRPGRIMGAQAQLYRFLDRDLTVVILANTDRTDLDVFVARIGKAALAHEGAP
nr:serine hydrolase domain-containing protein [uncultured Pseudoxanthomonas sp.]